MKINWNWKDRMPNNYTKTNVENYFLLHIVLGTSKWSHKNKKIEWFTRPPLIQTHVRSNKFGLLISIFIHRKNNLFSVKTLSSFAFLFLARNVPWENSKILSCDYRESESTPNESIFRLERKTVPRKRENFLFLTRYRTGIFI